MGTTSTKQPWIIRWTPLGPNRRYQEADGEKIKQTYRRPQVEND